MNVKIIAFLAIYKDCISDKKETLRGRAKIDQLDNIYILLPALP